MAFQLPSVERTLFVRLMGGAPAKWADLSDARALPKMGASPVDLIDLDTAWQELGELEPRYFGGLENAGIAAVLKVSEPTVVRDWRVAPSWLYSRLQPGIAHSGEQRGPSPPRHE